MGEVIAFRPRRKTSRGASEPPTGDAQILFFLGVRYMRMDTQEATATQAPESAPPGGGKRKRRVRAS